MCDRAVRALAALLVLSSIVFPSRARSQNTLPQREDVTTPPRGVLRLRTISAWERYDARFIAAGGGATQPLGAQFTSDSLGVANIPQLAPIQNAIQSATGSPFKLTLGQSQLNATTRVNIVPIAFEYGITNRLSVSAFVPIVRQRIALEYLVSPHTFNFQSCFKQAAPTTNPCQLSANVGPNPGRTSTLAEQENLLVQTQFANAATMLSDRLASCQANPSGAGCAQLLARQSEAEQLISSSQTFASDLGVLYGAAGDSGMAFVPVTTSQAQAAIAARVDAFNAQYRDFLSSSSDVITALPVGAGFAGSADVQRYLTTELRRDSITNVDLLAYGDVELGAKFRVLERLRDSVRMVGAQAAVEASVRLPTGSLYSPSEIADVRMGGGRTVVDSRGIVDLRAGRLGLLAAAHLGVAVSTRDSTRATPDTRVVEVDVAPRWHLSEPLAIHAAYTLRSYDVSGSEQLVGGGVSFLSPSVYRRGAVSVPLEMRFTHLEALSGSAGRPKFNLTMIELRISYRLLGT